ncbi:hypothetical protein BSG1_20700 [Bacillus sp. SG-1]|nr:hypothetical protein BSG1_20700 [Bacillus sp. SG-1]
MALPLMVTGEIPPAPWINAPEAEISSIIFQSKKKN